MLLRVNGIEIKVCLICVRYYATFAVGSVRGDLSGR